MIPLGCFEFLSLLDPTHVYSAQIDRRSYSRTITYFVLLRLFLNSDDSCLPLSKLRNYFNDMSQINARQCLDSSGLITLGHDKTTTPTRIYLNRVILAPRYETLGKGHNILTNKDLHFLSVLREIEVKNREYRNLNNPLPQKAPLPRTWCRAFLVDLLYRALAREDKIIGQPTNVKHMSRITQWRARRTLVHVGRIRRAWIISGHARSPGKKLEINLEKIPTVQSLAKPHPLDVPPQYRFRLKPRKPDNPF